MNVFSCPRLTTLSSALLLAVLACTPMSCTSPNPSEPEAEDDDCSYPLTGNTIVADQPLPPLAWPEARDNDGNIVRFSVRDVHQSVGQWSPFDVLVFVAIPSW